MEQFWLDRPTFITGATGLVGNWVVKNLIDVNADIVCIIRDWVPKSEIIRSNFVEHVKVVRGDIRTQDLLERILGEYEIDTVIHLAAQTIVPIANRNPTNTFETNIKGTWNVLEACRKCDTVKQIVIASSDKAYGEQDKLPYTEKMCLMGKYPYDVSKSCTDLIAQSYAVTYGLPVVITRCGNFYGGGDLNWNRIIPGTIRSIIRGKRPIIRSDGSNIRDYFYVEDGAMVYLTIAQALSLHPNMKGEAFNFSNEDRLTVLDIVKKILRLMESDLVPIIKNDSKREIRHQYLSSKKARTILKWKPIFSLDEGLIKTINWYKSFFGVW